MKKTVITLFVLISSLSARADVIMEGWNKVLSAKVHIGYVVYRFEYDPKTKMTTSKSFLRTNEAGGDITESVEATSNEGFQPVSFKYTNLTKSVATKIDAKFAKGQMTLIKEVGGKKEPEVKKNIDKVSILSSHLPLVMLKNGISVGKNFEYKAIAEEDGVEYQGKALIKEITKINDIELFRILNRFKDVQFVSLMSKQGQIVSTNATELGLSTELTKDQSTATGSIPVPLKSLKLLFGKLP